MSSSSRRILPPGGSRKRKESEDFHFLKPQGPPAQATKLAGAKPLGAGKGGGSNQLLAGYMAYEFLTKGTLFGEKFDPARAEAVAVPGGWRRSKAAEVEASEKRERQGYAEVASIMQAEGTHIPGIVNPTQLSRWIQM